MEYSEKDLQFIYDLCDGLNILAGQVSLKGRFIPEVLITNAKGSFKCFKDLHFSLFYTYKSRKSVILTINFVGKSVEGSLKESIEVWKRLITSQIMKWLSDGELQKIFDDNGRAE